MHLHVAVGLDEQRKSGVVGAIVGILVGDSVVVNHFDRHEGGKLCRATEVIEVKMGGDEIINVFQSGDVRCDVVDASGVSSAGIS